MLWEPDFTVKNAKYNRDFPKKHSLGMSGLRSSRNLLEAPTLIRMVLAVGKHLQMTKAIILDKFDFKIFSKSIPWACLG